MSRQERGKISEHGLQKWAGKSQSGDSEERRMPPAVPRKRRGQRQQDQARPAFFLRAPPCDEQQKKHQRKKNSKAEKHVVCKKRQGLPFGDFRALVEKRRGQIRPEFETIDVDQRDRAASERREQHGFDLPA